MWSGKPTQLSAAISFLTEEYDGPFFAWELVEVLKKLLLVGAMSVLMQGQVMQLVIAFVIVLCFLVALIMARPYRRAEDDAATAGTRRDTCLCCRPPCGPRALSQAAQSRLPFGAGRAKCRLIGVYGRAPQPCVSTSSNHEQVIALASGFALCMFFFFSLILKFQTLAEAVTETLTGQLRRIFAIDPATNAALLISSTLAAVVLVGAMIVVEISAEAVARAAEARKAAEMERELVEPLVEKSLPEGSTPSASPALPKGTPRHESHVGSHLQLSTKSTPLSLRRKSCVSARRRQRPKWPQ